MDNNNKCQSQGDSVPEPSMFLELEPEGLQAVGSWSVKLGEEDPLEEGPMMNSNDAAADYKAGFVEGAGEAFYPASSGVQAEPVVSASANSAKGSRTSSVTSTSDVVTPKKRQHQEHTYGGPKKRGFKPTSNVTTPVPSRSVSSSQGKRRRKTSSTMTASSATGASPTSSVSSLIDSTSSRSSSNIPILPPLPMTSPILTRPSIIHYANSSTLDSSSEQSSTTSEFSPVGMMHQSPGSDRGTSMNQHQNTVGMKCVLNGHHSMLDECNLVTLRSSDRVIGSWSNAAADSGPKININQFRQGPGFIELGSLLRSRLTSSGNQNGGNGLVHHLQVGHRQGPALQPRSAFPFPTPRHQSTASGLPQLYSSPSSLEYVTVPVYHDNPKTDRTIRCFGCQDVLNRIKIPLKAGRRSVPRIFKPETYYCKFCLNRKFATQDHYEYC